VFQARYGFSKVSSVSVVGGRPVGMGIDIVITRLSVLKSRKNQRSHVESWHNSPRRKGGEC